MKRGADELPPGNSWSFHTLKSYAGLRRETGCVMTRPCRVKSLVLAGRQIQSAGITYYELLFIIILHQIDEKEGNQDCHGTTWNGQRASVGGI